MKFMWHSLTKAATNKVLPVPGAPNNNIPVLIRMGHLLNNSGYCKQKYNNNPNLLNV